MKLNRTNKKIISLFFTTIVIILVFAEFIIPVKTEELPTTKDSFITA